VLVLGVARGGVPVAAEIASEFVCQLDVAVARKIGAPANPEFAIGAVAAGGEPIINEAVIRAYRISKSYVDDAVAVARREVERRTDRYREGRAAANPAGRVVIVADDGVATGSTLIAVLRAVRAQSPLSIICAVPVGPADTIALLENEADNVICPLQPEGFMAVGTWFDDFAQLSDDEVVRLLRA